VILWAGYAYADDSPSVHAHDDAPALHARDTAAEPLLHLDPMFAPVLESPFATTERGDARVLLGRATEITFARETWNDATTDARGFTAGVKLSHDFGLARLTVSTAVGKVDSRFGSQTYINAAVALVRTLRLSRWTTAWISLGLNYQRWSDDPVSGPAVAAMLRLGLKFR
jgi:hypothetical protein